MVIATMLVMHHIMAKAVIVLSLQSPLLGYDVLARTSGARICSEDFLRYEMLGKCRCEPAPVLLTKFCNYCSRMLVITNQWKQKQCVIFCFYLLPKSARRIHNECLLLFTCMHNALSTQSLTSSQCFVTGCTHGTCTKIYRTSKKHDSTMESMAHVLWQLSR